MKSSDISRIAGNLDQKIIELDSMIQFYESFEEWSEQDGKRHDELVAERKQLLDEYNELVLSLGV